MRMSPSGIMGFRNRNSMTKNLSTVDEEEDPRSREDADEEVLDEEE